jgi:hypothetical protein
MSLHLSFLILVTLGARLSGLKSRRMRTWTTLRPWMWQRLSHPVLEGKSNANHVRARISYSRTQQLHNMDIITQCSK